MPLFKRVHHLTLEILELHILQFLKTCRYTCSLPVLPMPQLKNINCNTHKDYKNSQIIIICNSIFNHALFLKIMAYNVIVVVK